MKVLKPFEFGAQSRGDEPREPLVSRRSIILGLSRAECLEIGNQDIQTIVAASGVANSFAELLGAGSDVVAVLAPQVAGLFPQSAAALFEEVPWHDLWATILLPWREPPTTSIRADGLADSFCCAAEVFSALVTVESAESGHNLCFKLFDEILNGRLAVQRLVVRQLPLNDGPVSSVSLQQNATLIMAHRGPEQFLISALRFANVQAGNLQLKIRVGLDLEEVSGYRDLAVAFPQVEFFGIDSAPAGPYVIRQALIDGSTEDLIVFHDSDDISCHDRVARQAAELVGRDVDVVGSHELRVNESTATVEVYRFPLDVSAALALPGSTARNDRANEPILHPTVTMTRSGFVNAGGFSTNRKIANDTQFMLRAYFSLRMRNVDEFLYIRRRHAHALTVQKETALGNSRRHFLGSTWGADFEAVKNGKAKLNETSLRPRKDPAPHQLTRLWESENPKDTA